jgi:hypothetical protein
MMLMLWIIFRVLTPLSEVFKPLEDVYEVAPHLRKQFFFFFLHFLCLRRSDDSSSSNDDVDDDNYY